MSPSCWITCMALPPLDPLNDCCSIPAHNVTKNAHQILPPTALPRRVRRQSSARRADVAALAGRKPKRNGAPARRPASPSNAERHAPPVDARHQLPPLQLRSDRAHQQPRRPLAPRYRRRKAPPISSRASAYARSAPVAPAPRQVVGFDPHSSRSLVSARRAQFAPPAAAPLR